MRRVRMTRIGRRTALLLVPVLALAAGGAYALAAGDGQPEPAIPQRAPAAAVGDDVSASFAVLRGARSQADAMPATAAAHVRRFNPLGMNPDLARRSRSLDGIDFYVVPGRDALCLASVSDAAPAGAGGTCGSSEQALGGAVVMAALTHDGVRLSGIAPDGVERVAVALADGGEVAADVVGNVYSVEVAESVAAVRLTRGGEAIEVATPFTVG